MRVSSEDVQQIEPDFRLKDLRQWHIVEAVCWHCKRTGEVDRRRLIRGRAPETRLVDLEQKLRCKVCDERGPDARHNMYLRKAPRN